MAERRGLTVREGGETDLGAFFRLMRETCRRQETAPNPATEAAVRQIWAAFHPRGRFRLILAEYEREPVAAALCLCFGRRLTIWKKGWSGRHPDKKPNHLVMLEALKWAHAQGFQLLDCVGMNREMAAAVLRGDPLTEEQKKDRTYFFLGFGGRPVLLPEARVHIPSSFQKSIYRLAIATPLGRYLLRRVAARTGGG